MVRLTDQNRLSLTHPELAAQWHPTKNGSLTPDGVSYGSKKKVWWKCPVVDDHEWEASPNSRTSRGSGCGCCVGQVVVPSNCLMTTHPELAAQWHPTKNGSLTPYDVVTGSNKKVWWKCPVADDHEWKATVNDRFNGGNGCSCCTNRIVVPSNCLMTTHPELAAQWHSIKNGSLTPYGVVAGSHKKVWWKCPVADDHEWEASPNTRTQGSGCPCCSNYLVVPSNCLMTMHPELAAQWHPIKNGSLTPYNIVAQSSKKVWWKCPVADDHEWEAVIVSRVNGRGCPCCRGLVVVPSNCLVTMHPELAAQWHPTKNGSLTPYDLVVYSGKAVWWQCPVVDDHEWESVLSNRTWNGNGCPYCNESRGEKAIASILSQKGYRFEREVKFDDCTHQNRLSFDFLVWLPDGKRFLIEFQGRHHYELVCWNYSMTQEEGDVELEKIQKRDRIKKQYADDNGAPLLVIPYWDMQIMESLIEDFIRGVQ